MPLPPSTGQHPPLSHWCPLGRVIPASEPQLQDLSLPCCVRREPDVGEAVGFGKLPFVALCLPSWPGYWLTAPVTHGSESVPGGSFHSRPHANRPAGLQGEDISG